MSIESATFVGDLQPANPPSTDPRGQGDDHLRLIKQVLQNSFPGLEKAWYVPTTTAKSANFSVAATDMNNLFLVATTGGSVVATLPSGLLSGDAGWRCKFMKTTTDTNPIFVAPATGTLTSGAIGGLSQARRCIPGIEFEAIWTGSGWIITRCQRNPIGTIMVFNSATLPAGYEWPNGQTLSSSANYPEYNAANGGLTTLDMRGRIPVTLDNLGGSAAGRLSGGIITGTTVGNTGGTDVVSLVASQIPTITSSGSISGSASAGVNLPYVSSGVGTEAPCPTSGSSGRNAPFINPGEWLYVNAFTVSGSASVSSNNTGSGAHSNLQPSIMCARILVVE